MKNGLISIETLTPGDQKTFARYGNYVCLLFKSFY